MEVMDLLVDLIPLILMVCLIVWLGSMMTSGKGFAAVREAVPAVIVMLLAVLIIGSISGPFDAWEYDEETRTLTITGDVPGMEEGKQPWAGLEIREVHIEDGVKSIGAHAFDEWAGFAVTFGADIQSIDPAAFPMPFKDGTGEADATSFAGMAFIPAGESFAQAIPLSGLAVSEGTITGLASGYEGPAKYLYTWSATGIAGYNSTTPAISTLESAWGAYGLASIGAATFRGCASLTSVSIPSSVTSIGGSSFRSCASLTSVSIPSSVASIGSYAFGSSALTSVSIPSSVTVIENDVFRDCSSLTSVSIPSSVATIKSEAFQNCTALTSVEIPEGVETIGSTAFSGCSYLASASIPSSVTSIGANAFAFCSRITSVSFAPEFAATIASDSFRSWTFYDSDGTTVIDKTVASGLAGHTFVGTASKLVLMAAGQRALTTEQGIEVQKTTYREIEDLEASLHSKADDDPEGEEDPADRIAGLTSALESLGLLMDQEPEKDPEPEKEKEEPIVKEQ